MSDVMTKSVEEQSDVKTFLSGERIEDLFCDLSEVMTLDEFVCVK